MNPRAVIQQIENNARVPDGRGDRFEGYSVIGQTFQSGHVLALRRFPASSVGPAYTSLWHRDPLDRWTFYSNVAPDQGCTRYFSFAVNRDVVMPIHIGWPGPSQLLVVAGHAITWAVTLTETPLTRAMSRMSAITPESWLRNRHLVKAMGAAAGLAFGAGKMNLAGRTPNGQEFLANPGHMWLVDSTRAIVHGQDIGEPGPLPEQARLRDVWIPQRGIFAVTRVCLEEAAEVPEVSLAA
jgi:hypothetical protein